MKKFIAAVLIAVVAYLAGYFTPHSLVSALHETPTVFPSQPSRSATSKQPLQPRGPAGSWKLAFNDEFDGTAVDLSKWSDRSSAEADGGHGNLGNQQLEWNQLANCRVNDGLLTMTAKRDRSHDGYDWTSCLLTTNAKSHGFKFRYGYIEERSKLPAPKGFWPAFWTWQVDGADYHAETDAYEYFSDNPDKLYLTQQSDPHSQCEFGPAFDPSSGFHTYGVDIGAAGTTWYIDGVKRCHTSATSSGSTNIITNLAVYNGDGKSWLVADASTRSATKQVDYIRAWRRS